MYSSYSAAAFALRASKPSLHAHSSYSYAYLPSHHCHREDDAGGAHHHELLPQSSYLTPRFLLDGYLLRHSAHLLLLSARLHPPPPQHPHPPRCCHRRAAPRCCDGGSRGPAHGRVSWRTEPRGCRCSSGRGAARSDLGADCRRFEARGCCCGGSDGRRLLGGGCRQRHEPRLLRRAVQQEVWEYDGEWPHRRCSTECHCDWEQEEDEEFADDWRLSSERWEYEDDVDGSEHRCRDCGRRNSYYNSGRRRDMDEYHGSFRDSDQRRRLRRDYHDEDLDLRSRRQSWEGRDRREHDFDDEVDMRRVGNRKYVDDGRSYDRRRECRNFDYDDGVDVMRSGRHSEDTQRTDLRRGYRDFEIDDEVDVRREGRRHSSDDRRYVLTNQRRVDDGDDDSLLRSRRRYEDDQDLAERRYYSEGRSQKPARASELYEDDENRASSSRNTFHSRRARHEENSSSRVRWHDSLDRQTSDERDYDGTQFVRIQDTRTGTQDVKVITEDDTRLASSSNNTSILKHSSNVDQKTAEHNDESRKSSQNITEISEVRGSSVKQDTSTYHQEDMSDHVENRSSSLESSVKMASNSRRQVDQYNEVNQQSTSLSESRKNTEKFADVTADSSRNVNSASHLRRNYDEVNQTDIDDRSASIENITHVTRDKKRIVNQKVIHETDIDVQNVAHVDVSKIHASDISVSRGSQNHSKTGSDVNMSSNMNFIGNARGQEEQVNKNKVYSSDTTMVSAPQSHLQAEMYGRVHSTPSTNISDNTKGTHYQVELTKAHTKNSTLASTSDSHLQTRTDDQLWSTSAVNTISSVNEQHDLGKIQTSDDSAVIISQGFHIRNGNQDHRMSAVKSLREHRGMGDKQSTQDSITQRNDEQRIKFAESSQESREKLVRLEDTETLMQHNMDLIWQKAGTSGISNDKDITSLQIDSAEDASPIFNADMAQQAIITESNEPDVRREPTAESSAPSGSNGRQSVNESLLESAARLEKSSTFHVRQFVDELHKGTSDAGTASTNKNERYVVEGITSSSSGSRMKGPPDEMWDVQSTTSQETFKTADKEEGSSADGATNSPSQTPNNESALAKKVHRSLWAYVADIIRLGWIQRGDSHDSSNRSVKKSSSSNSQGTEGWISSEEHDNDGIRKKYESTKEKDQQLTKSHRGEPENSVVSLPKEENLRTGTQVQQISGGSSLPKIGTSEGDLLATGSKGDQNISGERFKQSALRESPKGSSVEDNTLTLVDVTKGQSLDHKAATSSRNTTKGSDDVNTGKGMLADTSVTISSAESGDNGDGADRGYGTSGAIIPYHSQTQAVMPYNSTSAAMLESPALPVGGSMSFEEKNVVQEAPEVTRTEVEDEEWKRRMLQRNKQVLKETFDEWEEAYKLDAKLRKTDELFMREALLEAQKAADIWEVPVGAVLVQNGEIIARGSNLVEDLRDSTAHAEIVCIREASNKLKSWRLADTTLYVTLEPCAMCAGAILQARIDTVVWGAPNKLLGADGSWVRLFPGDGQTSTLDSANQSQTVGPVHPFHPKITIRRGVLATECSEIMQQFFQLRRRKKQRPQSPPRAHHEGRHHPLKFFSKMHNMLGANMCL